MAHAISGQRLSSAPRERPFSAWIAVLAASIPFATYLLTLIREVDWGDPAELAIQACRFGATHPPGAPVHTLLCAAAAHLWPEPAVATNFLSAVATAIAAAFVALSVWELTASRAAALLAAWTFGFLRPIWAMAVVTELYAASACFLSITLYLLLRRHSRPFWAGFSFALALGTYGANALLLPALVWLLIRRTNRQRLVRMLRFLVPTLLGGVLWAAFDLVRSRLTPPLGTEFVPDDLRGLLLYLGGAQYQSTRPGDPRFYTGRVLEHGMLIAKYLLGGGLILALAGIPQLARRNLLGPLAAWIALDLLYFTFHPYADYHLMVHPAYLGLSVAIGCGIAELRERAAGRRVILAWAVPAGAMLLPGLLLALQVDGFSRRAASREVTEFVRKTFGALPDNAVVFARWDRFTPLLYYQQVHGERTDLLILERQEKTRYYPGLRVDGWRSAAGPFAASRTVVVDGEASAGEPAGAVRLGPLDLAPSVRAEGGKAAAMPGSAYNPGRVVWMKVLSVAPATFPTTTMVGSLHAS